jgi:hypothetical protein
VLSCSRGVGLRRDVCLDLDLDVVVCLYSDQESGGIPLNGYCALVVFFYLRCGLRSLERDGEGKRDSDGDGDGLSDSGYLRLLEEGCSSADLACLPLGRRGLAVPLRLLLLLLLLLCDLDAPASDITFRWEW